MTVTPSAPRALVDDAVRRRIREQLDESQVVEAAAGTGKTRVLVDRILAVLTSGRGELSSMAVVTFTEKAAGELKLRVRQRLAEERAELSRREGRYTGLELAETMPYFERLARAVEQFEEAHISTIHGFCADILREHPVEAGIDPDFDVLGDDVSQGRFFAGVFSRWFDRVQHDPPAALARVLRRRGGAREDPLRDLRRAALGLIEHRELDRPWALSPLDRAAALSGIEPEVALVAAMVREAIDKKLLKRVDKASALLGCADELSRLEPHDLDGREALMFVLRRRLGDLRWPLRNARKLGDLSTRYEQLCEGVEAFCRDAGAELAPLLQRALQPLLEAYSTEKLSSGRLDFGDLLLATRALLRDQPAVRAELQRRFSHVFVDEFQDTDPLQADVLLGIANSDPSVADLGAGFEHATPTPGKLFVVGDPKQSIYRFRRAEVELYERIKRELTGRGAAVLLELTTSFRSVPAIQQSINAAFAPLLPKADLARAQPAYVPLAPFRRPLAEQPPLVVLPLPAGERNVRQIDLRAAEPERVAAFVEWLIKRSGWRVTTRAGAEPEPVRAHHVCLLFRALRAYNTDLTEAYGRGLERRGIGHVVVGGRSFFRREEVDALRVALRAIEWPDDQLSVYATLRGPLFGIDDETLLLFYRQVGHFHPLRPGDSGPGCVVRSALDVLGELTPSRNRRPIASTVGRLLSATRCLTGFAMRRGGDLAVRSALRVQQLARQFQQSEALSFRAFVQYLDAQAELGADRDTPVAEEGQGGVRMMTVHAAKGLEFPVVILADAACRPLLSRAPDSVTDRSIRLYAAELCGCRPRELLEREDAEQGRAEAESLRLLYVATTRARDLLVVPSPPDLRDASGWLTPLAPVISSRTHLSHDAPGCPPARDGLYEPGAVTPGLHRPQQGDHEVVWWDAAFLSADAPQALRPLPHFELLKEGTPGAAPSAERYQRWSTERADALRTAEVKRCDVWPATRVAHTPALETLLATAAARDVEIAEVDLVATRSALVDPRVWGSFVHEILETADAELAASDPQHLEQVASICGRLHGIPPGEQQPAVLQTRATFAHPLMCAAQRSARRLAEAPITLPLASRDLVVEGIADLVYLDDEGVLHVVDYKTDLDPSHEQIEAYRRQVALYLRAIELATGLSASGHLLFV
ncbi:MAG: UvrD-helicase domain-containing protein [Myxococcales bacterium]|nr:UvrD-helicase domain-containing protein [Myxococcales bacterium]